MAVLGLVIGEKCGATGCSGEPIAGPGALRNKDIKISLCRPDHMAAPGNVDRGAQMRVIVSHVRKRRPEPPCSQPQGARCGGSCVYALSALQVRNPGCAGGGTPARPLVAG